jgi:hypothetical protein
MAFVAFVVSASAALCCEGPRKRPDVDCWAHTLELGLEHTPKAKAEIARIAEDVEEVPVKRLASVLLEEWDLTSRDQNLASPRPVWAPTIDVVGEEVKSPLVIIVGEVLSDGSFVPREFKVGSGSESVDERCLEAAKASLFRPARSPKKYIRGPAAVTFHFYL